MRQQQGASRIVSVGYHLPETRIKTSDLLESTKPERFGLIPTLIERLIGIREVRHSAYNEKPSDLAIAAGEQVLAKTDVDPDEIDLIIFCGIEGDYAEPSTAHVVQATLGLSGICFDISNACLGFMTGIHIANDMIKAGSARYALVCTGEKSSNVTKAALPKLRKAKKKCEFRSRMGALTVGDAGAAVLIGPKTDESGIVGLNFNSDGKFSKLCFLKREKHKYVEGQMDMKEISNAMLEAHKKMLPHSLSSMSLSIDKINCLVTHQVGKRPWNGYSSVIGVPTTKMTKTYDMLGNITSATFAINYARALESGTIKKGDKVFAAMAGSGLSICQTAIIA